MRLFKRKPIPEDNWRPLSDYDDDGNLIEPEAETEPQPEPDYSPDAWNDLDTVLTAFHSVEMVLTDPERSDEIEPAIIPHPFSIRNACEGVSITGGIGSGKTSGSGAQLAKAYLRAGFGGLVLCAKNDEAQTWRDYAHATGRAGSVVEFDISGKWCFPFLDYEVRRGGAGAGNVENIVRLLMTVQESIEGGGGKDDEAFWRRSLAELLRNAVELALAAGVPVSVPVLEQIVNTAPMSEAEAMSTAMLGDADTGAEPTSYCGQLIAATGAAFDGSDKWREEDIKTTTRYWLRKFPTTPEKQRGSVISMFSGIIDNFMRRPFRQLFSEIGGGENVLVPELCFEGILIILNFPVKEFGDAGRAVQIVYKYLWQQAMERRPANKPRPVFLWVDESQNFSSDYDMQFQATARSSKACTVYLTQNYENYFAEISNPHRVNSLIANLATKIWHAQSDPGTNEKAADTIGKSWQSRASESQNIGGDSVNIGESEQQSLEYDVIPQIFTTLRTGGVLNQRIVEAIIFQNGRIWHNGRSHIKGIFKQSNQ